MHRLRVSCLAALWAGVSFAACAQTPAIPVAPTPVSRSALLACLEEGDAIEAAKVRLEARHAAHAALQAKVQAADTELNAQVRRHAPATPAEVASYNKAIARRNAVVRDMNDSANVLNRETGALNQQVFRHNEACSSLQTTAEDAQWAEDTRRARQAARAASAAGNPASGAAR